MSKSFSQLSNIPKTAWSSADSEELANKLKNDPRVERFVFSSENKDGRVMVEISASLGNGECLNGTFTVGKVAGKLATPEWEAKEKSVAKTVASEAFFQATLEAESRRKEIIQQVENKYNTTTMMLAAVASRVIRGNRLPDDAHWKNASNGFFEGLGGNWKILLSA